MELQANWIPRDHTCLSLLADMERRSSHPLWMKW
jgi:hypothetical protein